MGEEPWATHIQQNVVLRVSLSVGDFHLGRLEGNTPTFLREGRERLSIYSKRFCYLCDNGTFSSRAYHG